MKKQIITSTLTLCCLLAGLMSFGQEPFGQCAAAFLNTRMVVDDYSPQGQCRLPLQSTGELTVQTVDLSPTESKALAAIPFKVAIRDGRTHTLTMYAQADFVKLNIQDVMKRCRKGDSLVLLTTSDQYALPHNEILIQ